MRSLFDFTSWQGVLSTLLGLVLVTVIGVGIRLVVMQRVQQRHERQNRQINERLKTLIAAYRTLGGSFTGNLAVDPSHLRDVRTRTAVESENSRDEGMQEWSGSERSRRTRDSVEAALSDVVLLGTAKRYGWLRRPLATWWPAARSKRRRWCGHYATSFGRFWTSKPFRPIWRFPGKVPCAPRRRVGAATWRGRVVERGVAAVRAAPAWPPAACWA